MKDCELEHNKINGHWHSVFFVNNHEYAMGLCSNCHRQSCLTVRRIEHGIYHIVAPYCSMCGSKMISEINYD